MVSLNKLDSFPRIRDTDGLRLHDTVVPGPYPSPLRIEQ
jgi:hypothetical protein